VLLQDIPFSLNMLKDQTPSLEGTKKNYFLKLGKLNMQSMGIFTLKFSEDILEEVK